MFLCQKTKKFLKDFTDCETCEDKEKCIEYNYEVEFLKKKEKKSKFNLPKDI